MQPEHLNIDAAKTEFESYLKELIDTHTVSTETVLNNPNSLSTVSKKSIYYNAKAQSKIIELASKYNLPVNAIKMEVAFLIVQYHGKLLKGHL